MVTPSGIGPVQDLVTTGQVNSGCCWATLQLTDTGTTTKDGTLLYGSNNSALILFDSSLADNVGPHPGDSNVLADGSFSIAGANGFEAMASNPVSGEIALLDRDGRVHLIDGFASGEEIASDIIATGISGFGSGGLGVGMAFSADGLSLFVYDDGDDAIQRITGFSVDVEQPGGDAIPLPAAIPLLFAGLISLLRLRRG